MQYSSILLAAVAAGVANAVAFTNSAFNGITAGQPIDLTWGNATGPVTITLKKGDSSDLKTVNTIASGQTGSSFTWNVPSTLPSDTYALEISDSAGPNYSPQFQLIGGSSSSSATGSTSTSSSASSSLSVSSSASSTSSVSSSITSSTNATTTSESATTTAESTSATGASNSTVSRGSSTSASSTGPSQTGSRTSSSAASPTGSSAGVPNSNSGAGALASPLALVFLTFAAIFSLN